MAMPFIHIARRSNSETEMLFQLVVSVLKEWLVWAVGGDYAVRIFRVDFDILISATDLEEEECC